MAEMAGWGRWAGWGRSGGSGGSGGKQPGRPDLPYLPYLPGLAAILVIFHALLFAQADPRTALLERDGWNALAAGRAHEAAEAFRQAIQSDPKNARLHLGAGAAALLERRNDDARQALEYALSLDPTLDRARALLGQVLYRSGDLPGAIRTYETLTAGSPDDKQAMTTLERWRREAELNTRLQQTVGSHFTVSFEGPAEASLAEQALDALERAFWRIGGTLGTYPYAPIPVVLYSNEQFRDITRSPSWAAGAYDGTIRVPMRGALDNPEELDRVLAHEFTHALVREIAPHGVPAWLNEGLATALESGDLAWAEKRMREANGANGHVPIETVTASFGRLSGPQAALAYAASALAVRRMIDDAGGPAVVNLLRDLGEGVSFDAAFTHRMQRSFDDFEASLARRDQP
jgi:tetratricopeptide (TPR) repeat protein